SGCRERRSGYPGRPRCRPASLLYRSTAAIVHRSSWLVLLPDLPTTHLYLDIFDFWGPGGIHSRAYNEPLITAAPRSAPATSHVRWTICALLFFATTITYVDRQVLSLLANTL